MMPDACLLIVGLLALATLLVLLWARRAGVAPDDEWRPGR